MSLQTSAVLYTARVIPLEDYIETPATTVVKVYDDLERLLRETRDALEAFFKSRAVEDYRGYGTDYVIHAEERVDLNKTRSNLAYVADRCFEQLKGEARTACAYFGCEETENRGTYFGAMLKIEIRHACIFLGHAASSESALYTARAIYPDDHREFPTTSVVKIYDDLERLLREMKEDITSGPWSFLPTNFNTDGDANNVLCELSDVAAHCFEQLKGEARTASAYFGYDEFDGRSVKFTAQLKIEIHPVSIVQGQK